MYIIQEKIIFKKRNNTSFLNSFKRPEEVKILSYLLCRIKPHSFKIKHCKFNFYEVNFKMQAILKINRKNSSNMSQIGIIENDKILLIHLVGTFHHFWENN